MDPELARYRTEQAESYLKRIRALHRKTITLEAEVKAQREIVSGLTGIDYSKVMVGGSTNPDKIPDGVVRLHELIGDTIETINEYVKMLDEATRTLDEMGGLGATILKQRYVFARTWKQIGDLLNYSPSYLKRVSKEALCVYYAHMPAKYRDPLHQAI